MTASAAATNPQTFNRYSYVTNSPLTQIDPTGMFGISPGGSQLGGIGNIGFFYRDAPTTESEAGLGRGLAVSLNTAGTTTAEQSVIASDKKPGVCSIELVIHHEKSPENQLQFPTGDQSLGPMEGMMQEEYGWFWKVEVRGTVKGDASTWFLRQRVSERDSDTVRDNMIGDIAVNHVARDEPDNPAAQFRQQPKGQSKFFFIDAPGPKRMTGAERNTTTVQNFFTYVERGRARCGMKWSLTTVIENDVPKSQQLRKGHF